MPRRPGPSPISSATTAAGPSRSPTSFAENLHRHGAIPFVQIDPTLASVAGIARGAYDEYLRSYADSVRDFGHAVIIGFGHEMNAPSYSWGYHHVQPADVHRRLAAHRHAVPRPRRRQRHLAMDASGRPPGHRAGRRLVAGRAYVSWVGIDGYYYRPADTFASVFGRTIAEIRKLTEQPVLLSETAVGPAGGPVREDQ